MVLGRGGVVVLADALAALHVLLAGRHEARVDVWRSARASIAPRPTVACASSTARASEYLRRFIDVDADDRRPYHLIVDTVALGIDASVELVVAASRVRTRSIPERKLRPTMLSPRESVHAGTHLARRPVALRARLRVASAGPSAGGRARCRATRDARARRASTTSCRRARRATTWATSGTSAWFACRGGGTGSGSSCASTPPRTGRRCGSATRRSSSTRAATRRSRPTSPSTCARARRRA